MKGFVCLEKQEKLIPFTFGDIKLKELVLTDINPFPGYYSETPGDTDGLKPKFVFVAMKQGEGCYEDEVLRATCSIKQKLSFDFDANFGRFLIFNTMKPCIRFKVEDYASVPEIIENFKNEGIRFESAKKVTPYESNIKIRKYLTFKKIEEDIYTADDADHYYLKIPKHLKWKDFVDLILSVRGSGDFGVFDAAQTSLYLKDEIIEFVRIYTKSFKNEDFIILKEELIKRL